MNAAVEPPSGKLPLRAGVLKYQFPRTDSRQEVSADELIEQMCEECISLEAAAFFNIEFDRVDRCFDVFEYLEVWDEEEERRGRQLRGIFDIGEQRLSPVLEAWASDALAERINLAIQRSHALLEDSLKRASNADRMQVWAREEKLSNALKRVPATLFAKYTITDWFHGNAEAEGGPRLLDIHLSQREEPLRYTAGGENLAIEIIATHLRDNPDLRKADAVALLEADGPKTSDRGFEHRVWPAARVKAGLPANAPGGRKRQNRGG